MTGIAKESAEQKEAYHEKAVSVWELSRESESIMK